MAQLIPNVNGKAATRITAKVLTETPQAYYLDCEGDKHWIPKSACRLNKGGTVDLQDWIYKQKFPNG